MSLPGEDPRPEIGTATVLIAIAYAIEKIGLPLIGIRPNFEEALIVWGVILFGLLYVAWFFPWKTPKILNKWIRCIVVFAAVVLLIYKPMAAQRKAENAPPLPANPSANKQSGESTLREKLLVEVFLIRNKSKPGENPQVGDRIKVDVTNIGSLKWFAKEAHLLCDGRIIGTIDRDNGLNAEGDPGWPNTDAISNFRDPTNPRLESYWWPCKGKISVEVVTSRNNRFSGRLK